MQEIFFPYDEIRNEQEELIADILNSLKAKKHMLVHAPTGLGKTIASLGPALKYAQDNNLKIFFVTPRHTQHTIAIETVKAINKKFNINISVVDFLGKKHMWEILEKRKEREFSSFDDIKERVNLLPDPEKIVIKRILMELNNEDKYRFFVGMHSL